MAAAVLTAITALGWCSMHAAATYREFAALSREQKKVLGTLSQWGSAKRGYEALSEIPESIGFSVAESMLVTGERTIEVKNELSTPIEVRINGLPAEGTASHFVQLDVDPRIGTPQTAITHHSAIKVSRNLLGGRVGFCAYPMKSDSSNPTALRLRAAIALDSDVNMTARELATLTTITIKQCVPGGLFDDSTVFQLTFNDGSTLTLGSHVVPLF